jgi:hypothetical protein
MAFDIYHAGYELGYSDGIRSNRRCKDWELRIYPPAVLLFMDADSFIKGYHDGYYFGLTKEHRKARDTPRRPR